MINETLLRQGLQKLVTGTELAIRDRLKDERTLEAALRERHAQAVRAERTEGSKKGYDAFSSDAITQAAVHWLLGCVFVRFLEDNGWLHERNSRVAWIAGPGGSFATPEFDFDLLDIFLLPFGHHLVVGRDELADLVGIEPDFTAYADCPKLASLYKPVDVVWG